MLNILFDLILIITLLGTYIYNAKTGKVIEFEQKLWNSFCGTVNSWIRKYERRKRNARTI